MNKDTFRINKWKGKEQVNKIGQVGSMTDLTPGVPISPRNDTFLEIVFCLCEKKCWLDWAFRFLKQQVIII